MSSDRVDVEAIGDSAAAEWRQHWPLVVTATAGFSLQALSSYSLGLFMEPLGAEFGWGRAQISTATVIPAVLMVLLSPSTGAIIDRWGSRWLAIPGIVLTALSLAMIGLANGSAVQWTALWLFYGLVSLGVKATVWTTVVSHAFSAGRGLALGLALCGTAVAQIIAPPLAQGLIDSVGWRQAYLWLGVGWATPCLILSLIFLHDVRGRGRLGAKDPETRPSLPGLTFREALRSVPLQRIGAATLLTLFIGSAILIHQVPILVAGGLTRSEAAWLASLSGVAAIAGKLVTGWMTDRWNASTVGSILLTVPAIAYFMLLEPDQSLAMTVTAMMVIGYTAGAKLQISAYLTARYAGMRHYGKIFGVMTSLIGIGGALGSVVAGAVFDTFGNYDALLIFGIVSSFVCGALLFRLGKYPDWTIAMPSGPGVAVSRA